MLASVLPGLRELRTPLAVGYLWGALTWFVLLRCHAVTISLESIARAAGVPTAWASGATVLAVMGFFAYLLGVALRIEINGGRLEAIMLMDEPQLGRVAYKDFVNQHASRVEAATPWLLPSEAIPGRLAAAKEVSPATLRQLLFLASPERYGEYDRLHSEAEFRLNVAPPLALWAIALAVSTSGWYLAGLAFPAILLVRARSRLTQAIELLTSAFAYSGVQHPISELSKEMERRAEDESREARAVAAFGETDATFDASQPRGGSASVKWTVHVLNNNTTTIRLQSLDLRIYVTDSLGVRTDANYIFDGQEFFGPVAISPGTEFVREGDGTSVAELPSDGNPRLIVQTSVEFIDSAGRRWNRDFDGQLSRALVPVRIR